MTAAAAKADTTEVAGKAGGTEAELDGADAALRMIVEGSVLAETDGTTSDDELGTILELDGWGVLVRRIMVEGGTLVDAAPEAASDRRGGTEEEVLEGTAVTSGEATEEEVLEETAVASGEATKLTITVEVDDWEAVRLARILDASSGERVRVVGGSVVGWAPTVTVTVTIFGLEFAPFVTEGAAIVDS